MAPAVRHLTRARRDLLRRAVVALVLAITLSACGGSGGPGEPTPPPTGTAAPTGPSTVHVAPTGADTNDGSEARPWATLSHAISELSPGDTLVVAEGTYPESVAVNVTGSAASPITIRSAANARPVVRAAGEAAIDVGTGAAYVTLDGLSFEGATGESSTNIYVSGDAHDITFRACQSRRSARQGFFSERTTRNVVVEGCSFSDNGGRGPDNLDHNLYVEGTGHRIVNNVIVGAKNGYGIQLYPATTNVVVANNTIVGNRSGIIVGAEETAATTGVVIVNNIVANNERTGISSYWANAPGSGNIARSNLLFRNGQGDLDKSGGGLIFHANTIANPKFVDVTKRDFRLQRGSAAEGRAAPENVPETDFSGAARPSTAADVGAFER